MAYCKAKLKSVGDRAFSIACHHGMERPRVADGGQPPDMEVSCEYVE
jgi:hypothetical protein